MEDLQSIWVIEQYHMVIGDKTFTWHQDGAVLAVDSKEKAIREIIRLTDNAEEAATFLSYKYEYKEMQLF